MGSGRSLGARGKGGWGSGARPTESRDRGKRPGNGQHGHEGATAQGEGPGGDWPGLGGPWGHSQSSRGRRRGARRRSLWGAAAAAGSGIRGRLPRPNPASGRGAGEGRGQGARAGAAGGGRRCAWPRLRREGPARLVCSRRDLQGARGGGPRGRPPARVPAPSPAAAEVHEVCGHQGH